MNISKQFQTRLQAEVEGVWVPLSTTAKVRIARSNNPKHVEAVKRLTAPFIKPGMKTTDIPDATWDDLTLQAAAETILVDWEGVLDDTDNPLPYSREAALTLLRIKDFSEFVFRVSTGIEHYREARLAELEKNS